MRDKIDLIPNNARDLKLVWREGEQGEDESTSIAVTLDELNAVCPSFAPTADAAGTGSPLDESVPTEVAQARKLKDRDWNDYPLGTKAFSIGGGHWVKVERGWKWFNGSTFPQPGGDASGQVELPREDCKCVEQEERDCPIHGDPVYLSAPPREDAERPQAAATELADFETQEWLWAMANIIDQLPEGAIQLVNLTDGHITHAEVQAKDLQLLHRLATESLAARETSRQLATLESERDAYKLALEEVKAAIETAAHEYANVPVDAPEFDIAQQRFRALNPIGGVVFAALTAGTNEESK